MLQPSFLPGQVITWYGIYRCACGAHEIFGVSGRNFPRAECGEKGWTLVRRAREETFF
jgi:hypothetical protein